MPRAGLSVLEEWRERSFQQFRIEKQENGRRGVDHVYGPDAAVAGILFGQEERLAIRPRHQNLRRQGLPVSQGRKSSVLLAPDSCEIGYQVGIKLLAARRERRVIPVRLAPAGCSPRSA